MGGLVLFAYGILLLVGMALLAAGAMRRSRNLLVAGAALLLALGGLWMVGFPGALVGLVPLAFTARKP